MDKQTTVSPEMVSMTKRKPIKLEMVSSPERTSLINTDLHEILSDASSACDFNSYVDTDGSTFMKIECSSSSPDGSTFMKIECLLSQDEKVRAWDLLRFKYGKSCGLTTYPYELIE